MRFLLLDDQRSARVVLKRLLEDRPDIDVVEASNAEEARVRVETQEIDAMLLDIRLSDAPSDRGGLDFLRWVRSTGRSMPAVMVTGVSELAEIREAMRQGAQDYVLKDELCAEMILPIVDGIRERFALRDEVQRLRACRQSSERRRRSSACASWCGAWQMPMRPSWYAAPPARAKRW
jgi:two-component system response regulator HydG